MDNLLCIESEIAELYYREKEKARGIIRKNVQYDMQILTGLQTYIDMVLWHSLYRPTKRKNYDLCTQKSIITCNICII